MAKLIIQLDQRRRRRGQRRPRCCPAASRSCSCPNYNVTLAERIIPAADLSEQISLAGKEASGTGNMKLALNGALTIGTLDGANIEIRDRVGADNFFLFGLTADEARRRSAAGYRPRRTTSRLRAAPGASTRSRPARSRAGTAASSRPIVDSLLDRDEYMVLADYRAYVDCQDRSPSAWPDTERWTRMSILNTARCGYFSSDRTVREYCAQIWKVDPVRVSP